MQSINFPHKENPDPAVPDSHLSIQVLGRAPSNGDFLFGAFVVAEGIRHALDRIGRPLDGFRDVLDFGCGSGRVLRWFKSRTSTRWTGADISAEAIEWNKQTLGFGNFAANGMQPPLPFADESFDLVYAVSVVTHLSEALQFEWLAEIKRVLRPGGIAMLTVSGEEIARWKLSDPEFAQYRRVGHMYKHVQQGLHGLPDFYQDSYHSRDYVLNKWANYFRPLAYVRNGLMYLQDLAIAEKAGPNVSSAGELVDITLPIGSFWSPVVAAQVEGDTLTVSGWTFRFDGRVVALDVTIDDKLVGRGLANLTSRSVPKVYPLWPGAENCGFNVQVPVMGLEPGPHVIRIYTESESLPFMTTYFFV